MDKCYYSDVKLGIYNKKVVNDMMKQIDTYEKDLNFHEKYWEFYRKNIEKYPCISWINLFSILKNNFPEKILCYKKLNDAINDLAIMQHIFTTCHINVF